jgi:hypothetical protein
MPRNLFLVLLALGLASAAPAFGGVAATPSPAALPAVAVSPSPSPTLSPPATLASPPPTPLTTQPSPSQGSSQSIIPDYWLRARVDRTGPSLRFMVEGTEFKVPVQRGDLQTIVQVLKDGDSVLLGVAGSDGKQVIVDVKCPVSRWPRIAALVLSALMLLLLAAFTLGKRIDGLILGQDERYSNSKFQMTAWFGALMASYIATVVLRWWYGGGALIGGVDLPDNLMLLSGMSTLTFAGAKAITQTKVDAAAAAAPGPLAPKAKGPGGKLVDLFQNDSGSVDLGDFQMFAVTLIAVAVYVLRVFTFLGQIRLAPLEHLPDVDTTILGSFGFSHGAYLAKKLASKVGEG